MSLDVVNKQKTSTAVETESPARTTLSIDELIIGRRTHSPIYDVKGVLLLADNQVITSEIKANLKNRAEGGRIQMDESDLSKVTLRNVEVKQVAKFQVDETLSRKIDMILDNGLMGVKNTGPSFSQSVVQHGRDGYDEEQTERLAEQHAENGKVLEELLTEATNGKLTDCDAVAGMATLYLKEMSVDTDNVLTSAMGSHTPDDIAANSLESALLAMALGIEMDFDAENIKNLGIAGLTHDWGMVHVPEELRNATHQLPRIDRLQIEKHPIYSMEMLQAIPTVPKIVPLIVYQVHEKYNGGGYPRGRKGNSIPIFARIIAVADIFISLTSPRPWRKAVTRYGAMECMLHLSRERSLDPDVMRALLRIQSLFPIGSFITLSNGSVARVIRANRKDYTKPIVQIIQNADGSTPDAQDDDAIIDLTDTELKVEQALPTPGVDEIPFSTDLFSEV
ncbi:Cyclic di-GMP phosphodiesterase response regulator RpfG [Polystyrenella longa]|uniref:Cyclic di-GMP phosphodiesterase response regulator RpfG n=1 Tax=Polystyrenella longa TaxID=2528007 RepID=A0A518CJU5_9PLAN|nr:HD domain-containing phosphohydrolase [Polystyrenella longa]QDU79503.1 Cyclic di-GMP phosphodiesterase response regulator RpfG [Polystyrenella longa]